MAVEAQTATVEASDANTRFLGLNGSGSLRRYTVDALSVLATGGTTRRTLATRFADVVNVKDFGAACDGATNDATALAAAQTVAASGAKVVYVPASVAVSSTLTLSDGVSWIFAPGAKIVWTGPSGGTVVQTDPADVVTGARYENMWINGGADAGTLLKQYSSGYLTFDRLIFESNKTDSVCHHMIAQSSGGEVTGIKRNIVFCDYRGVTQIGVCGTLLMAEGLESGYDGNPQVITLNSWLGLNGVDQRVHGINIKNWFDNNQFSGFTRVSIGANNAIGLELNSAGTTTNKGVYSNAWDNLAVDAFGTLTGRVGLKIWNTKLNVVRLYHQDPVAEGGSLVVDSSCESYHVVMKADNASQIIDQQTSRHVAADNFVRKQTKITLADDTATSIDLAIPITEANTALLLLAGDHPYACGLFWVKPKASGAFCSKLAGDGTYLIATTGALSGTTGTDNRFTVSAHTDGKIYLENRLAASVNLQFVFVGGSYTA